VPEHPVRTLVVNPGSSSLKLRVIDGDSVVAEHDLPSEEGEAEIADLAGFLDSAPPLDAAGVRFVHGGADLRRSVVVDRAVASALEAARDLAPLHNPPALDALRALGRLRPGLPLVACFDTAFFADLPAAAATYAVPRSWTEKWGVRRFGFHGLSHAWASRRAAALLDRPDAGFRVVTAHLGAGASLAAVRGGAPVDTTMGFTPLDGLVMATRSGSVDPGVLIWVQRHHGLSADDLDRILDRESGLLGLSGLSGDVRTVLAAAGRGDGAARLALDVYLHRLRASVAAMAAALGGLDALVFTGGVGEHSAEVRAGACAGLGFLGLTVDDGANAATAAAAAPSPGRVINPAGERVAVLVVEAREDLEIAGEVRRLLGW
jgi:acetate kinase